VARSTVGYTPGTGAAVESYPATADGAHREATVIVDPLNDSRPAYVTSDNRLQVKMDFSGTSAITSVAISTTSVTLIAADATNQRLHLILHNDTSQIAYVRLDASAAVIAPVAPAGGFSFPLLPDQPWESPRGYVGAATCIWPSTTGGGAMRVTAF
jgi:hypothetical protein